MLSVFEVPHLSHLLGGGKTETHCTYVPELNSLKLLNVFLSIIIFAPDTVFVANNHV